MAGELEAVILFFLVVFLLILLASAIKVVREYERRVIFRLGRLIGIKGPGVVFIWPIFDRTVLVDLRTLVIDVPKQQIVTRDNVSVAVDAVIYYRVFDPEKAVVQVQNYMLATNLLSQTTLRDVLGQVELDDLLSKREDLNKRIQEHLDTSTDPWGIKVQSVTMRDVSLPDTMVRAIAKQAEAERERRSRVIMAEGEFQAAQKMLDAALLYQGAPAAMKLRELQTLAEIAREKNLIIVTPTAASGTGDAVAIAAAISKGGRGKEAP